MLMKLQQYQFNLEYKKGTSLHIADTLSCTALPTPVHAKVTGFDVFCLELEHSENDHNPRLTDVTEELLKSETKRDQTLTDLQQTIISGWPNDKQQLATNLRPFWTFREELSIHNGIIYKGQQVLVPQSMFSTMLLNKAKYMETTLEQRQAFAWPAKSYSGFWIPFLGLDRSP